MAEPITEHAPAKVNLALHVTGQRADGYHLLDTLVVFTEAGDRVTARPAEADAFAIEGPFSQTLEGESGNLVLRARDLLRATAGRGGPVAITLEKRLPVASGIGGGSSDAAATLRALSALWGVGLPHKEAARLGADLPMCLAATTLRVRGIGDEIGHVAGLPPLAIVLVNPGIAVPTPVIFHALQNKANPPLPALPERPDFAALAEWLALARNDLEAPALGIAPPVGEALSALRAAGAAFTRMSGSGATCFGLFATHPDAARAAASIATARPSWYVKATRTIERADADVAH